MQMRLCKRTAYCAIALWFITRAVFGATIYVDNLKGADAFNGKSSEPIDFQAGPVKSIRRAQQLAGTGDTIVLANTGVPYYETVQLVGGRKSGAQRARFRLIGNGAVISGAKLVSATAWKKVGEDLWKITPHRKGHYQLILKDKALPEQQCLSAPKSLPDLKRGQWCAWRGSIYLHTAPLEEPRELPYAFASLEVGLTLYEVHDVQVVDVTFRHFRLDGINAHDRCTGVLFENVKFVENGRAGLSVGGTSVVVVRNCELMANRKYSVLLSEQALVTLDQTQISQRVTTRK